VHEAQAASSPEHEAHAHIQGCSLAYALPSGGVAEWLNAAVSKTVMGVFSSIEGSNPSPSAKSRERPGSSVDSQSPARPVTSRFRRPGGPKAGANWRLSPNVPIARRSHF
jgi:hypothetical protein